MAIGWSKHLPLLPLLFLIVLFSSFSLLRSHEYSLDNAKVVLAEESITATTKLSGGRGGGGGSRGGGSSRGSSSRGGASSRGGTSPWIPWHGGAYGHGGSDKEHKKNAANSRYHLSIVNVLIILAALGTVILA